jgi:Collagen triple helix repeat (20 copies)
MFSAMRKRLRLTPTTVIAVLALVFAMTGGAYAAGRYVIISTKQISPKVLKSLLGKAGPAGKNGASGAPGATGPAGATGAVGAKGEIGATGPTGATGPKGETGAQGAAGQTGFTETLPKGKTLKGEWSVSSAVDGNVVGSVSFGIPLKEAPTTVAYVKAPTEEERTKEEFPVDPAGCTGNVENPGATEGVLCVFGGTEQNISVLPKFCGLSQPAIAACYFAPAGGGTADKMGFGFLVGGKEEGPVIVSGTWAVTAE